MPQDKEELVKKYKQMLKKQDDFTEEEFEEIEHKLSEEIDEATEGLGIEKEEEAGEEPYPEIEEELKREDNGKDKEEED